MIKDYVTLCGETMQYEYSDEIAAHEYDCEKCQGIGRRHPVPFLAQNIVNQILDMSEASVERRQAINDLCDQFVTRLLEQHERNLRVEIADQFARMCQHDGLKHYQCTNLVAAHDAYLIIRNEDFESGSAQ